MYDLLAESTAARTLSEIDARHRPMWALAVAQFRANDPRMARLAEIAEKHNPFEWPEEVTGPSRFPALVLHIIGQQISIAAACTMFARLTAITGDQPPNARQILALPTATLRTIGITNHKAWSIHALAHKVDEGSLQLENLDALSDAEVTETLTAVPGIGNWTAQMFLIHQMRRPDVFPAGDIRLRKAIERTYRLPTTPSVSDVTRLSRAWQPFRTYATAALRTAPHAH